MGRKIFRSGNSTVVSIPPEVLELLDLEPGNEVNVMADPEHRRILVTPSEETNASGPRQIGERLDAFIDRYRPALERLAAVTEPEGDAEEQGIDADALDRARALRQAFAARYGVLSTDLVAAVRAEREAEADLTLQLREEDEAYESGR
jgi:putative addiction module antidote